MSEQKDDPWFIIRVVLTVVVIGGGLGFGIYELVSNKQKASAFRADVKERCTPVYKTLDGNRVTSIYRCPDDTRYEFTERI